MAIATASMNPEYNPSTTAAERALLNPTFSSMVPPNRDRRKHMPYRRMGIDMQKNGLDNRSEKRRSDCGLEEYPLFFSSLFLSTILSSWGSVPKLSGRANAFDYHSEDGWGNLQTSGNGDVGHNQSEYGEFVWSDLDPYAAFIYGFGDLNCHTKAERSWK